MFKIRLATAKDIAPMAKLLDESWHRTYDDLMGVEKVHAANIANHNIEKLTEELTDPDAIVMIAENEHNIVGAGKIELRAEGRLYLDRLHVSPQMYGTGLGAALTDAMLALAPLSREIELSVLEGNVRAVAHYQKQGFAIAKKQNSCETILDIATLIMRKSF